MIKKNIDAYYDKIVAKIESGEYVKGDSYKFSAYCGYNNINQVRMEDRTPEICSDLMNRWGCTFADVPEKSITREFLLNRLCFHGVYEFVKEDMSNPNSKIKYDRQFFKDAIETNDYCLEFKENCFELMPLKYIDEEMCSLAIIHATNRISYGWFYTVMRRKPSALNKDLWTLGARLYTHVSDGVNEIERRTPKKYKTQEYYKEMCRSCFNYDYLISGEKGRIMDHIPQEVITPRFVKSLVMEQIYKDIKFEDRGFLSRFNNKALEMEIDIDGVKNKVWKYFISSDPDHINYVELNDERVEYFLMRCSKNVYDYYVFFKQNYKKYLEKQKRQLEELKNIEDSVEQTNDNTRKLERI